MEFTIRVPARALAVLGAVAAVLAGLALARLWPTDLLGEGYSVGTDGSHFGFMRSYEPTGLATYAAGAAAALALYGVSLLAAHRAGTIGDHPEGRLGHG